MNFKFKPFSNPILFVSDNPALVGGLSRIGRDLATLTCTLPEFRVGYLGMGIGQRRKLPFPVYDYPQTLDYGLHYIKEAWADFSDGEPGIIMTLDDISRRGWMADELDSFFGPNRTFKKWMYSPIDSVGPDLGSLPAKEKYTLHRYDRVLAASEFGQDVMKWSQRSDADWLPHGIWGTVFNVGDTKYPEKIIVGSVMANQARKDFPETFRLFQSLLHHYGNRFQAWLHTDTMLRYWDVQSLIEDYGLGSNISVTVTLSDEELAKMYRACSCTVLITGGEGFGYPIAESLSCGTACVTTGYAAGPEIAMDYIKPRGVRVDTQFNVCRAINDGVDFVAPVVDQIEFKLADWEGRSSELAARVSHLDWSRLQIPWMKWMREGLK